MTARRSWSNVMSGGRNSGNMTDAMNSTATSGMPRQNSMKIVQTRRTTGIVERRPSASTMPSGSDATMPDSAMTRVSENPPQRAVSTGRRPSVSLPAIRKKATTGKTSSMKPATHLRPGVRSNASSTMPTARIASATLTRQRSPRG